MKPRDLLSKNFPYFKFLGSTPCCIADSVRKILPFFAPPPPPLKPCVLVGVSMSMSKPFAEFEVRAKMKPISEAAGPLLRSPRPKGKLKGQRSVFFLAEICWVLLTVLNRSLNDSQSSPAPLSFVWPTMSHFLPLSCPFQSRFCCPFARDSPLQRERERGDGQRDSKLNLFVTLSGNFCFGLTLRNKFEW